MLAGTHSPSSCTTGPQIDAQSASWPSCDHKRDRNELASDHLTSELATLAIWRFGDLATGNLARAGRVGRIMSENIADSQLTGRILCHADQVHSKRPSLRANFQMESRPAKADGAVKRALSRLLVA